MIGRPERRAGIRPHHLPTVLPGVEPTVSYQPPPQPWQPEQPTAAHYPPQAGHYPPGQVPPTRPIPPGMPTGMPAQWGPPPPAPKRSPFKILAVIGAAVVGACLFGAAINNITGGNKTTSSGTSQPDAVTGAGNGPASPTAAGKPAAKPTAKPAEANQFNVPVGAAITSTRGGSTITATLRGLKSFKKACDDYSPDPKNGLLVVVDVVVTQTAGNGSVNPLDFTFVADDGTSANGLSGSFSGCDDPRLQAADLRAGQKRAGKIAFDVSSASGSLEWSPGGLGAKTAGSWKTK